MRIPALDSLRGIAALSVAFYHSILVFPALEKLHLPEAAEGDIGLLLAASPPGLLWAGREAVLLFFVLSGFVLALAFLREPAARPGWAAFAAQRAARLLPPCIAIALALGILVPLLEPVPRPELSAWFNAAWATHVTLALVLGHALLLLDEYVLNSPMWTLHYELRVSLIFPLIVALAALGSPVLLAAAAAGLLICLVEMKFIGSGVLTTLLFLPHFALGAVLARHRHGIAKAVGRLGPLARIRLWLLCYLLLRSTWLTPATGLVGDLLAGLGAALLIALVLGMPRLQAALCLRPLPWVGSISYSYYLVHVPVLLTLLHLGSTALPAWLLAVAAPFVALPFAWLLYRSVEQPAMRLGRYLGARLDGRRRRLALLAPSR